MKRIPPTILTVAAMLSAARLYPDVHRVPAADAHPVLRQDGLLRPAALLGAFALGPVYGVVISFMKNLLHIIIKGTSTACVGELCNFMLGAVFSAVAGFVYKRHKSRKTAILGAIAGAASWPCSACPPTTSSPTRPMCSSTTCRWKPFWACIRPFCLCRQPDQVPCNLQYALHAGQGSAGCSAVPADL